MKIRYASLLALSVLLVGKSFAQVRLEPFWPYSNYALGISIGNSHMYGDLNTSVSEPVYRATLDKNFNSYVSVGLELQHGALASKESQNDWTNGLSEYNQFTSLDVHGRVSLGQFFKYPHNFLMKNLFCFYFQTGFGVMLTDITNISEKFMNRQVFQINDIYEDAVSGHRFIGYIPYNFGYNLHLTKRCSFNVNYQYCYAFSDYVDGYNFPQPQAHNYYNDMYSILTFGLTFNLGKIYDTWYDENGIKEKVRHLSD